MDTTPLYQEIIRSRSPTSNHYDIGNKSQDDSGDDDE